MPQAMIISLGGTPEPIVRSICEHQPRVVCFFASQKSVFVMGNVKEMLDRESSCFEDSNVVLVDDVDDLLHCYEKALECSRFLESRNIPPDEVVVDYTGGTKNMTAALALATVGKGYRFSYVGGSKRSKGGLGVVEDGAEIVHKGISPWQIFAVEEWRQLVLHTRHYHYEAALNLIREIGRRQPPGEQMRWKGLERAFTGLLHWDRFNHEKARPEFSQGIQELEKWSQIRSDPVMADFADQGRQCLQFLNEMAAETRGFKQPGFSLLVDLVANAERRAEQGHYDDAVARLYRSLEMQAQIAFFKRTGASTSDVPPEIIPQELKEEYLTHYREPQKGKIQVPLFAAFRLLHTLGDEAGHQFFEKQEEFAKILSARNSSILAHGLQPLSASAFESFKQLIRSTFHIEQTVRFPELKFPF